MSSSGEEPGAVVEGPVGPPPAVGQFVGPYLLERELGRGGTATVYAARHRDRPGVCALKVLHPRFAASIRLNRRLEREVRILADLAHPNLVAILDSGGPPEAPPYLVTEWVPGPTLAQVIADFAPLPRTRAAELLIQIARGLAAAHRAGIIHRDLKPANVILSAVRGEERAKILDFGLARALQEALHGTAFTQINDLLGTPAYMSPEQIRDPSRVGPRSDLYSLGLIGYELLSGHRPTLRPANKLGLLEADLRAPPLPGTGPLERLIMQLLEVDLELRPADADHVVLALEASGALQPDLAATLGDPGEGRPPRVASETLPPRPVIETEPRAAALEARGPARRPPDSVTPPDLSEPGPSSAAAFRSHADGLSGPPEATVRAPATGRAEPTVRTEATAQTAIAVAHREAERESSPPPDPTRFAPVLLPADTDPAAAQHPLERESSPPPDPTRFVLAPVPAETDPAAARHPVERESSPPPDPTRFVPARLPAETQPIVKVARGPARDWRGPLAFGGAALLLALSWAVLPSGGPSPDPAGPTAADPGPGAVAPPTSAPDHRAPRAAGAGPDYEAELRRTLAARGLRSEDLPALGVPVVLLERLRAGPGARGGDQAARAAYEALERAIVEAKITPLVVRARLDALSAWLSTLPPGPERTRLAAAAEALSQELQAGGGEDACRSLLSRVDQLERQAPRTGR